MSSGKKIVTFHWIHWFLDSDNGLSKSLGEVCNRTPSPNNKCVAPSSLFEGEIKLTETELT